MVGTLHRQVEQVVDHQHLRFAAFEAAHVDNTGDDHLQGVDAAYAGHGHEDPVAGEQLDHKALDPWWSAGRAALHHDIAHLSHLVPGAVEDWQAPDA